MKKLTQILFGMLLSVWLFAVHAEPAPAPNSPVPQAQQRMPVPTYGYRMPYPNYYGAYAPYGSYGSNPLHNPTNNGGYWAHPNFRPWNSGPFAANRWGNHPMNNMPWGRFPGWGNGFFGGYGPDRWKGITPWGNDVPFRWVQPNDPKEAIAEMWEDAINTPHNVGRMPPGWTAPHISVPNPVDVADEFERNARNFPDEMRKMVD